MKVLQTTTALSTSSQAGVGGEALFDTCRGEKKEKNYMEGIRCCRSTVAIVGGRNFIVYPSE